MSIRISHYNVRLSARQQFYSGERWSAFCSSNSDLPGRVMWEVEYNGNPWRLSQEKRGLYVRAIGIPILKDRLLSEIQKTITSTLSGWRGRNVNVRHGAEEILFSLLAKHLLGLKTGKELEKMKHNFCLMSIGFFSLSLNVPGTTFHKSMQKRQELSEQIKNIMKERKKNMSSYDSSDDLLSSLLKEAVEKEDGDFEISTFQIVDFILSLLFVTLETTPKAVALAVKRISENPHIILELREEYEAIRRTKINNESLSWGDCKSMSVTQNVIKETLRLGTGRIYNMLMKKTIQNVELKGYTIPKGWTCMIFHEISNYDSNYYEDPHTFNPRRWQDPAVDRIPSFSFGTGPRKCPGNEFAMMLISIFLYELVTNFRWDYTSSDTKLRWFDTPFISTVDSIVRLEDLGK